MALVFDAQAAYATPWFTSTSMTWNHTCTGSNRLLVVTVQSQTNDSVTGATYNGIAMTLQKKANSNGFYLYLFTLIAPATGANQVAVAYSQNAVAGMGMSISYTGADQTTQVDSSNSATATAQTTFSWSTTTVNDNTWLVGMVRQMNNSAMAAGANTVLRLGYAAGGIFSCDSNGAQTPPGSKSLAVTDLSDNWLGVIISINPVLPLVTGGDENAYFM